MPNSQKSFLISLTAAEMKKLLVARERIDVLLAEKEELTRALSIIDGELSKLMDGAGGKAASSTGATGKKRGRKKKVAAKKATEKKRTVKKVAAKKVTARKKAIKKTAAPKKVKTSERKTGGRIKLEDVVVKVIKSHGKPMTYKELIAVIVKKKLFTSKSSNFDNVLRRTLSTSKLVKRVGRGIYSVA